MSAHVSSNPAKAGQHSSRDFALCARGILLDIYVVCNEPPVGLWLVSVSVHAACVYSVC